VSDAEEKKVKDVFTPLPFGDDVSAVYKILYERLMKKGDQRMTDESLKESCESESWGESLEKYCIENERLRSKIENLRVVRNVIIGVIVVIVAAAFMSPVEVKVGDVCLSCWGKK
jgi:hypothetical protein